MTWFVLSCCLVSQTTTKNDDTKPKYSSENKLKLKIFVFRYFNHYLNIYDVIFVELFVFFVNKCHPKPIHKFISSHFLCLQVNFTFSILNLESIAFSKFRNHWFRMCVYMKKVRKQVLNTTIWYFSCSLRSIFLFLILSLHRPLVVVNRLHCRSNKIETEDVLILWISISLPRNFYVVEIWKI